MARSTTLLTSRQWALRDGREQGRLWGVSQFLRINVLSEWQDLKRFTSIRLHVNLKQHPSDSAGEIVLALLEAIELDSHRPVFCSDIPLEMEGYSMESGSMIQLTMLPNGRRPAARGSAAGSRGQPTAVAGAGLSRTPSHDPRTSWS